MKTTRDSQQMNRMDRILDIMAVEAVLDLAEKPILSDKLRLQL